MTKTPDDIKKGLECCMDHDGTCEDCPYVDGECRAFEQLAADALALIQQLQAENADQAVRIQQLEKRVIHLEALNQSNLSVITMQERTRDKLQEQISQLEAERDAAVDGLKSNCTCPECKYFSDDIQEPCRGCKPNDSKFEWRGVQKE